MIINIHPREISSHFTVKIIEELKNKHNEEVLHISDKTIQEWQQIIKSSEPMRFVGPVYWWGVGHEMEKWMQQVFAYGFAFIVEDGKVNQLLKDRKFEMTLIYGNPAEISISMKQNIKERLQMGAFGYVGSIIDINFYCTKDIKDEFKM